MAYRANIHTQLSIVNSDGSVDAINPKTSSEDVAINTSNNKEIPQDATTLQNLVDQLNGMAFSRGNDLIYIKLSEAETLDSY